MNSKSEVKNLLVIIEYMNTLIFVAQKKVRFSVKIIA